MILHVPTAVPFYCSAVFHCMDISQFVHSPVDRHVSYFHFWVIVKITALTLYIQVFVGKKKKHSHLFIFAFISNIMGGGS